MPIPRLYSLIEVTRCGTVVVSGGASELEAVDVVAARVERVIALHSPEEISRHGTHIRYRASVQRPTWDALAGVSHGVVEVTEIDRAYVVHYELNFSVVRMLLAMWVGTGMLWISFGVLVLEGGPISLGAAIQLTGFVILVVPLMGVVLFAGAKANAADKMQGLLRRAVTAELRAAADARPGHASTWPRATELSR